MNEILKEQLKLRVTQECELMKNAYQKYIRKTLFQSHIKAQPPDTYFSTAPNLPLIKKMTASLLQQNYTDADFSDSLIDIPQTDNGVLIQHTQRQKTALEIASQALIDLRGNRYPNMDPYLSSFLIQANESLYTSIIVFGGDYLIQPYDNKLVLAFSRYHSHRPDFPIIAADPRYPQFQNHEGVFRKIGFSIDNNDDPIPFYSPPSSPISKPLMQLKAVSLFKPKAKKHGQKKKRASNKFKASQKPPQASLILPPLESLESIPTEPRKSISLNIPAIATDVQKNVAPDVAAAPTVPPQTIQKEKAPSTANDTSKATFIQPACFTHLQKTIGNKYNHRKNQSAVTTAKPKSSKTKRSASQLPPLSLTKK